jgi:putative hydrolase of the HAD superfamily
MKPHPSAFSAALTAIGVTNPANAVFVGDRPYDDISGAKSVGMHTVLRANPYVPTYDVEPDAVIDSLVDLLAVIDRF